MCANVRSIPQNLNFTLIAFEINSSQRDVILQKAFAEIFLFKDTNEFCMLLTDC